MNQQSKEEFIVMISDYMEKGFLDNIIDMFKYDESLYYLIPIFIADERLRVRIGAIALVESLQEIGFKKIRETADAIVPLLKNPNSYVRGDSAYCLGVIGDKGHIVYLKELFSDLQSDIIESAKDAVIEINNRLGLTD
ncbi:MAG: HEAT repeat domain-containing protein [Nitrospirae bacterium]|nr:HEAT repeat domain-containing protein [Nitrospirota bacterium]MBF0540591.1 HEAT repeat domain-containing protein [Nitrospirota bacterium]